MVDRIHVIDADVRRRAKVAYELCLLGIHVEIYEDVFELLAVGPTDGVILAADASEGGGEALGEMRRLSVALPMVGYAQDPRIEHVVRAMLGGAAGYLNWPFEGEQLLNTLDRMLDANTERRKRENAAAMARSEVDKLTPRERQVLIALIAGMSNKEIARSLNISHRTVEIHRSHMMTRLRANSVAEAVKIGIYANLDGRSPRHEKAA